MLISIFINKNMIFFLISKQYVLEMTFMDIDTIAAISTPVGEGAISIVRLSGPEAIDIAKKVFRGTDLSKVDSHTIHYGHIVEPDTDQIVDEVLVTIMKGPKTYTRED